MSYSLTPQGYAIASFGEPLALDELKSIHVFALGACTGGTVVVSVSFDGIQFEPLCTSHHSGYFRCTKEGSVIGSEPR
ncbi:MAG: hypothetical protein JJ974_12710 [Phycisphaerales bacterium]|nr:hypothetical protein [Phycisphaerales bacterium]